MARARLPHAPKWSNVADLLAAPVARALLGKRCPARRFAVLDRRHRPSWYRAITWAMKNCDAVLIVGSTMPWIDSYPKPGAARAVQVDLKADRIGLRYPVEIGLVGDAKATLAALIPMLTRKTDRSFLVAAQGRVQDWNRLLDRVEATARSPLARRW